MNKYIEKIFNNKKILISKLEDYGFVLNRDNWVYYTPICQGQMLIKVKVNGRCEIDAQVYDNDTQELYTLYLAEDVVGSFVGEVRKEYEDTLTQISLKCCEKQVYKSLNTQKVIEYIRNAYGDELEFLWDSSPDSSIVRRKDNSKWYAVFMKVSKRKLGADSDEIVEVIDLRMKSDDIPSVVDNEKIFKGYHMNKRHWISVCLDGGCDFSQICRLIDDSYQLAFKK